MKLIIFFSLIFSLLANSQEKPKFIKGVFDNFVGNSYFIIKFDENGSFKYKSKFDLGSCIFSGNYTVSGDTLILKSTKNISSDPDACQMLNERWLIIDPDTIFRGDTIKPKVVYIDAYFKRNPNKENYIF